MCRVIGICSILFIASCATNHKTLLQPPESPPDGIFIGTLEIKFDNFQGINDTARNNIKFNLLQNIGGTKADNIKIYTVTTDENGLFFIDYVPVNSSFAVGTVYLTEDAYFGNNTFGDRAIEFCKDKRVATVTFSFTIKESGKITPGFGNSSTPSDLFLKKYPESEWAPLVVEADATCIKNFDK